PAGRGAAVLFDAGLLDRADGDRPLLGKARLVAVQWQHDGGCAVIWPSPARGPGVSPDAAFAGPVVFLHRGLRTANAGDDAGDTEPGLHAHRRSQGAAPD